MTIDPRARKLRDRSRIAVSRAMAPGWGIKGGINTPLGLFIIKQTKQTNKQQDHHGISHAVGPKARRIFCELTIQKRIDDPWYAQLLEECRQGCLSDESYNFYMACRQSIQDRGFPMN